MTYDVFTRYLRYLKISAKLLIPYLSYLEKTGKTGKKNPRRSGGLKNIMNYRTALKEGELLWCFTRITY